MASPAKYIPTIEAAGLIGCNERHVRVLIAAKKLIGQKVGRNWIVLRSSAQKFRKSETMGRPKVIAE